MLATVTLSTTTFASPVTETDSQVNLTSLTGIYAGVCLFSNRELFTIERLTGIGNYAVVRRGQDGTKNRAHSVVETVYIGRPDQFYAFDPQGVPGSALTNPHINTQTGVAWVIQGDDFGPGQAAQTWQPIASSQTIGALGVRVNTTTTPS